MNKQILITYASGSGSTQEVAEAIAEEIHGSGLSTIVQHVSRVDDVSPYSGVILGSSIRIGRWLPEAVACLERIKHDLPHKPLALFTTCLTMIEDTAESRQTVLGYMAPLLKMIPEIEPVGLGLFAGSLDPARLAIMGGEGPQGDYRNWEAIRRWAREVREVLLADQAEGILETDNAVLSYTDLSYSDLTHANLHGAELHATNLVETNLEASQLIWADLSHSQMQGANLAQANLIGSIMTESNLEDANLENATLNGAILNNANLRGANLSRADLNWVDFSRADLREANLQGARLGWAKLSEARLEGAILRGARYNVHTVWPKDFSPEAAGCINVGRSAV